MRALYKLDMNELIAIYSYFDSNHANEKCIQQESVINF